MFLLLRTCLLQSTLQTSLFSFHGLELLLTFNFFAFLQVHCGFGSKGESRAWCSVLVMESEVELPTRDPNACLDSFPSRGCRRVGRAPCLYCVSANDWPDIRGTWTSPCTREPAGRDGGGGAVFRILLGRLEHLQGWGCTVIPHTPSVALGVASHAWGCKDLLSFSNRTGVQAAQRSLPLPQPSSPAAWSSNTVEYLVSLGCETGQG